MKNTQQLPKGYRPFRIIDYKRNNSLSVKINFLAIGVCSLLYILTFRMAPMFGASAQGLDQISVPFIVIGAILYFPLHELIHGLAMALLCRKPVPKFRADGILAYAGSMAYYSRSSYLLISFAPIVVWGVVLAVLPLLLGSGMYWSASLLQILNLAGAVGDSYVAVAMLRMPSDTLVQDIGVVRVFLSASDRVTPLPTKKEQTP